MPTVEGGLVGLSPNYVIILLSSIVLVQLSPCCLSPVQYLSFYLAVVSYIFLLSPSYYLFNTSAFRLLSPFYHLCFYLTVVCLTSILFSCQLLVSIWLCLPLLSPFNSYLCFLLAASGERHSLFSFRCRLLTPDVLSPLPPVWGCGCSLRRRRPVLLHALPGPRGDLVTFGVPLFNKSISVHTRFISYSVFILVAHKYP